MKTLSPKETQVRQGRPSLTFRMTGELRQKIKIFAAANDTTIEKLMNEAAISFMDSNKPSRARAS
jgi:hypothetical protein